MYSFWCVVNIALLASRNITPHQNSYIYFHIQPITYKYLIPFFMRVNPHPLQPLVPVFSRDRMYAERKGPVRSTQKSCYFVRGHFNLYCTFQQKNDKSEILSKTRLTIFCFARACVWYFIVNKTNTWIVGCEIYQANTKTNVCNGECTCTFACHIPYFYISLNESLGSIDYTR